MTDQERRTDEERPVNDGDDVVALREEAERIRADLGREREAHLRTRADFENFRRRVDRDAQRASKEGRRDLILSLVDVAADVDRALAHAQGSADPVLQGVLAIRRRLETLLGAEGVVAFDSVGQPFDPHLHEAVGVVQSEDGPPGAVLDEVSRGYRWGDEVLRPARVLVAE